MGWAVPILKFVLNPLNWFKIASFAKSAWDAVSNLLKGIQEALIKRQVEKKKQAVDEAVTELKEANGVEDDRERLKKKADAACKLEKISNPNADCDSSVFD